MSANASTIVRLKDATDGKSKTLIALTEVHQALPGTKRSILSEVRMSLEWAWTAIDSRHSSTTVGARPETFIAVSVTVSRARTYCCPRRSCGFSSLTPH